MLCLNRELYFYTEAGLWELCASSHSVLSHAHREIVTGKPLPLMSKFRLSYYTLLNILRRLEGSGQSMEYVIARSFQQFQFEQSLPQVRWPEQAPETLAAGTQCWTPGPCEAGHL